MEEFKKYGKIKALGHKDNENIFANPDHEIIIQEKMDGANFRFYVTEKGQIIFGSRTQQLTSNEGEDSNVAKNFTRCVKYVREVFNQNPHRFMPKHIFYGECMVKHTMDYNWEVVPPFLGFDVYDVEKDEYRANAHEVFEFLGFKSTPIIKKCKAGDIKGFGDGDVPVTAYPPVSNPQAQAEGVVFKNYEYEDKHNNHMFAKYVRDAFKESNAETFGGIPKYSVDDAGKIVAKYCTNARIDKMIFKLIDDGHELDMPLMEHLPRKVLEDMYEEHWQDILGSNMVIDTRKVRKQLTRRCLMVLKQAITNNALTGDKQ